MRTFETIFKIVVFALLLACAWPADARHYDSGDTPGLRGATILVVRHAEKPADEYGNPGLAPAGEARAKAYADFFQHFAVDGMPVKIDTLIATADSQDSARPRLTLEPLSKATGIAIEQDFADHDVKELARSLEEGQPNRTILIAWHHGKIPKLLYELGADPYDLLPDGVWPPDTYDWVIVLKYDGNGALTEAKKVAEPELVH